MMLPGMTISPPYFLTPSRRPRLSRPLRDEPPAFLCAMCRFLLLGSACYLLLGLWSARYFGLGLRGVCYVFLALRSPRYFLLGLRNGPCLLLGCEPPAPLIS